MEKPHAIVHETGGPRKCAFSTVMEVEGKVTVDSSEAAQT